MKTNFTQLFVENDSIQLISEHLFEGENSKIVKFHLSDVKEVYLLQNKLTPLRFLFKLFDLAGALLGATSGSSDNIVAELSITLTNNETKTFEIQYGSNKSFLSDKQKIESVFKYRTK